MWVGGVSEKLSEAKLEDIGRTVLVEMGAPFVALFCGEFFGGLNESVTSDAFMCGEHEVFSVVVLGDCGDGGRKVDPNGGLEYKVVAVTVWGVGLKVLESGGRFTEDTAGGDVGENAYWCGDIVDGFTLSDVVFVAFVGVVGVSCVVESVEEGEAVVICNGTEFSGDGGFFVFRGKGAY